jgi:hypothetical protein
MKSSSIISLINKINKNENYKKCIKHSISNNVEFAHVWIEKSIYKHSPKIFFLIKNDNEYVGAILDMMTDLHWVILPKYRKKGYLTNALNEAVIPYLFTCLEREELKITINQLEIGKENYENSSSTALNLGFKKVDEKSFVLEEKDFDFSNEKLDVKHKGLEYNEMENIRKELQDIAKKVSVINSTIELSLGKSTGNYIKPSLDNISDKLSYFTTLMDDIKHDFIMSKD